MNLSTLLTALREREDINITFINTIRRYEGIYGQIECVLRVLWQTYWKARKVDVVTFHMCEPQKGIPIWLLTRLARKPFLVRWFDGADYRVYGSVLRRAAAKFMLKRADVSLLQTQYLVKDSIEDGAKRSLWFSNLRPLPTVYTNTIPPNTQCRKFIFLGHVREYKGIRELIAAVKQLSSEIEVHIYGPLFDDLDQDILKGHRGIRHMGELKGEDVVDKIREYDALVLPTKAKTEGYPGVIIESYIAGRPVVSTLCGGIPEIVDDTSGILVPPGDSDALYQAMKRITEDNVLYADLCAGAAKKRSMFSAKMWADYFVRVCCHLADGTMDALEEPAMEKF